MVVEIGMSTKAPLTKALWFDDVLLHPMELGSIMDTLRYSHPSGEIMANCWSLATSLGKVLLTD